MESLLDLYRLPYDPAEPVVCFDECPVQLLGEVKEPLPAQPGKPRRQDFEYVRRGTACLLACVEPLAGWRNVTPSVQRTKVDFAGQMKYLVDERYPEAKLIHVVLDNLNTHTLGALYVAFPAAEAHRIARKLRFHYTPVHGSWLNMAEIELSVLSRNCLSRRHPTLEALTSTITSWQTCRNHDKATIQWRFTVHDARTKFHRFYPQGS
jgi:transposase